MTPRDLLDVFVRLAGLLFLLYGAFDLYYVVVKLAGLPTTSKVSAGEIARFVALWWLAGFMILRNATWIVHVAYRLDRTSTSNPENPQ